MQISAEKRQQYARLKAGFSPEELDALQAEEAQAEKASRAKVLRDGLPIIEQFIQERFGEGYKLIHFATVAKQDAPKRYAHPTQPDTYHVAKPGAKRPDWMARWKGKEFADHLVPEGCGATWADGKLRRNEDRSLYVTPMAEAENDVEEPVAANGNEPEPARREKLHLKNGNGRPQ